MDRDKLIKMAQSGTLAGKSAEEIRALIRQAGMTESELVQYAREQKVDMTPYLKPETKPIPISRPAERQPIISVPGFANRADANQFKPFGYDIFQNAPTTFEPVMSAPTPTSYRVGTGDELIITVWGQTQLNYSLAITRDGYVVIPDVGKIEVAGQTIDQLRQRLLIRMSQVYESLRAGGAKARSYLEVSLGKIRTIQVFVLGNIQVPGGYNISGFSTAFTAVYYAGGPDVEGSLRNMRIVRGGSIADTIDFYDYILYGEKTGDVRLQDGDALFIPTVGPRVAIVGEVKRPAIYELKVGETLHNLITMAGGLRYSAYEKRVHVERIIPFHERAKFQKDVLDLDVEFKDANKLKSSNFSLEDGDIVTIFSVNQERENLITIAGNVRKPGKYELLPGMRVDDLIEKADGFIEDSFLDHATIVRTRPDLKREVLSFVPRLAMDGDSTQNVPLQRLDEVTVYKEQFFRPTFTLSISGAVRNPGLYLRTENMTVRNLIVLAGGLVEGADIRNIEIARIDTVNKKQLSHLFHTSLPKEYWVPSNGGDSILQDFDQVSVRFKPEFTYLKNVVVTGEVNFPGVYSIQFEGEKLTSLVRRSGGFKSTAYLPGVRFLRRIGAFGITQPDPEIVASPEFDTLALRYNLLRKPRLASNEVPIDIARLLKDTTSLDNLVLQEGDSLIVPRDPGVVYVEGQVYIPSSVPYKKGESLNYYLKQAGGLKREADDDHVVVVLPNDQKWRSGEDILSGSTIIAPFKLEEKSRTLEVLREWATIAASTTTLAFIIWQVTR